MHYTNTLIIRRALLFLGLLVAIFIFSSYWENGSIKDDTQIVPKENIKSGEVSMEGVYICLPHKNSGDFQTMECAFGFKSNEGNNYALDLNNMRNDFAIKIEMNRYVSVEGFITDVRVLSTDHWSKYDIIGILSLKNSTYKK